MTNNTAYKNYNMLGKYEIIGRIPNGTTIVAYALINRLNGQMEVYSKDVVEKLALSKQIYNASAQLYNNVVNLKGINCKLSQLPKYNANGTLVDDSEKKKKSIRPILKIVGRVQNSGSIVAYIIEYKNNNGTFSRTKVEKNKVLELAREGYIVNAKAQLNYGKLMLRGVNDDLAALDTYREE